MTSLTANTPKLAATLAQAVAAMLHWSKDPDGQIAGDGVAGEFLWHAAQLDLEIATEALSGLGITAPAPGETSIYQLRLNLARVHAHVEALSPSDLPPLDRIISAFLGVASLRGVIDVSRDAVFSAALTLQPAMKALADAGYAEHAGDHFRWREQIRPAMRLQHLWPEG